MGLHLQVPQVKGRTMNASEYRDAMEGRVAARVIAESCESCLQREFDFYLHDAFVCESCAAVA
jgi:hypothetical protein